MSFTKLFNYTDPKLDEELRRLIQELALQPVWIAPTFAGLWVNYGLGYSNAGYFKDQFGVVHLRGLVKNGAVPGVVFTLPVGYRPPGHELFTCPANGAYGQLSINSGTGNVAIDAGSNVWFSLAGISFRTV